MKKWTTSLLWAFVVAFALFYLYNKPEAAAEMVRTVFGMVESIGRFFTTLAQ